MGFHRALGVGIEHEELPKVRARAAQQVQAVLLGAGQGLLVAENHTGIVGLDLPQADEAAPGVALTVQPELLGIGIQGGGLVGAQYTFPAPSLQAGRRPGIDVVFFIISRLLLAQDDAHQVVRAGSVVAVLHGRRDLVIGLGDGGVHRHAPGVITQSPKGKDPGHGMRTHDSSAPSGSEKKENQLPSQHISQSGSGPS